MNFIIFQKILIMDFRLLKARFGPSSIGIDEAIRETYDHMLDGIKQEADKKENSETNDKSKNECLEFGIKF